jgi:hypothetical protein
MHKLQLIEDILNIISSIIMINLPFIAKGSTYHSSLKVQLHIHLFAIFNLNDFTNEPRQNVAFKIK